MAEKILAMNNEDDIIVDSSNKIANISDLEAAIKRLERKRFLLEEELKDGFHSTVENLKPANILKNAFHEVKESSEVRYNILKAALGLGAGYLSSRLVFGKSAGFLKKALGTALQLGITTLITKKDDSETGKKFGIKNLLKKILPH